MLSVEASGGKIGADCVDSHPHNGLFVQTIDYNNIQIEINGYCSEIISDILRIISCSHERARAHFLPYIGKNLWIFVLFE